MMGKILSIVARKAQRFNVENRAHKIISMEKPIPAPKHPATQREMEMLMKEHGDAFNELRTKNPLLDENLRKVYVTSTETELSKFGKPSDRSRLPMSRSSSEDSELGYEEPEIIPKGKITLKQALQVLTNRQEIPDNLTAEKIAQVLNIPQDKAVNLVNYFSSLKIHMPEGVPQINPAEKAKRLLIKRLSQTKMSAIEGATNTLRLDNPAKNKPD